MLHAATCLATLRKVEDSSTFFCNLQRNILFRYLISDFSSREKIILFLENEDDYFKRNFVPVIPKNKGQYFIISQQALFCGYSYSTLFQEKMRNPNFPLISLDYSSSADENKKKKCNKCNILHHLLGIRTLRNVAFGVLINFFRTV